MTNVNPTPLLRSLIGKTMKITGVTVETIDDRPQLMLHVVENSGATHKFPLDRDTARELRLAYGPHKLVDAFYSDGQGLQ